MAETTKIQWTDHTFNPWRGCTKISPGCANCYAEKQSHRNPAILGVWGDNGSRSLAAESYWREPLKWNRAAKEGVRRKVFCASLADVFEDRAELDEPRSRLFDLILQTPQLDWLLLTKRPEVMRDWFLCDTEPRIGAARLPHAWGDGWPNVWLGVSVEDQQRAKERIPVLLSIPAKVHWLSCEPLIGPIDISDYLYTYQTRINKLWPHGPVDWAVVGGESGSRARSFDAQWARDIRDQCYSASKAFFLKQFGERPVGLASLPLLDKKGGDLSEWPEDLQIRQFPSPT